MNQSKSRKSKSLQSSITLSRCYRSNTPTNISNSRNSFFKGDLSLTLNMVNNLNKNKKLKHKQKVKWGNENKDKMFLDEPYLEEVKALKRKRKSVREIPKTLKYKSQNKTRASGISKSKELDESQVLNKENEMLMSNSVAGEEKMIMNKELIKCSLKPNRLNFMSRVSCIYDLLVSKTNLPQFIEYFLGQALFIIRKDSRISFGNNEKHYDWKLEEFKKICEGIYENSEEEDLKHFMSLSLPSICRWTSKYSLNKTGTVSINSIISTEGENGYQTHKHLNEDRIMYFKSLNKREIQSGGSEKEDIDLIEMLHTKLDRYINSMKSSSIGPDRFEYFKELPHKITSSNEEELWRNKKCLEKIF